MTLYNLFRNLFVMRLTRDPMIGLAWWVWGKTPANLLARTALGLIFLAAFRYRRELRPYIEDPYRSIISRLSARKKK